MNADINVTCALPTYASSEILWLQLESLCRQETEHAWELLIAEEDSDAYAGRRYVEPYRERLRHVGCQRVVHYRLQKRMPLVEKWRFLATEADPASRVYIFCASDNYSPPSRTRDAVLALMHLGFDWYDRSRGYFYDIGTGRMGRWERPALERSGLFMATRTGYVRTLPPSDLPRNIDGFIRSSIKKTLGRPLRHFRDVWGLDGLHTDGCNQISHHRAAYYTGEEYRGAFHASNLDSPSALVPAEVARRLDLLSGLLAMRRAQSPVNLEPVL